MCLDLSSGRQELRDKFEEGTHPLQDAGSRKRHSYFGVRRRLLLTEIAGQWLHLSDPTVLATSTVRLLLSHGFSRRVRDADNCNPGTQASASYFLALPAPTKTISSNRVYYERLSQTRETSRGNLWRDVILSFIAFFQYKA